MRLTDKNIEAIRKDAENCVGAGMGDILLLCEEVQTRRVEAEKPQRDLGQITATALIQELIKCVEEKVPLRDADVLAFFDALQPQGYFQTVALVNRDALQQVLYALNGAPHLIRELQVTRGLPRTEGEKMNAIDQLIQDCKGPENATD